MKPDSTGFLNNHAGGPIWQENAEQLDNLEES